MNVPINSGVYLIESSGARPDTDNRGLQAGYTDECSPILLSYNSKFQGWHELRSRNEPNIAITSDHITSCLDAHSKNTTAIKNALQSAERDHQGA